MIEVHTHAAKRVSKRLGVPKSAVEKLVLEATTQGTRRSDISGSLRRYLDRLILKEDGAASDAIVYHRYVFLTRGSHLVTAWLLPPKYKGRKAAA